MATSQDLITRAQGVRDETQTGKNTAQRVGSLFNDIILFFVGAVAGKQDKQDNALETASKEVVPAINEVLGNISILWGNVSDALGELENDLTKDINAVKSKFPEGSGHVIAKYGTLELENPEIFAKYFDNDWGKYGRYWLRASPGSLSLGMKGTDGYLKNILDVYNGEISLYNYSTSKNSFNNIFNVRNGFFRFESVNDTHSSYAYANTYLYASNDGSLKLTKQYPYYYNGNNYINTYDTFSVYDGNIIAQKTYMQSDGYPSSFPYFRAEDGMFSVAKLFQYNNNQYSSQYDIIRAELGYFSLTNVLKHTEWGYESTWVYSPLQVTNNRIVMSSAYQLRI